MTENLQRPQLIVYDFDGVIVDSAQTILDSLGVKAESGVFFGDMPPDFAEPDEVG